MGRGYLFVGLYIYQVFSCMAYFFFYFFIFFFTIFYFQKIIKKYGKNGGEGKYKGILQHIKANFPRAYVSAPNQSLSTKRQKTDEFQSQLSPMEVFWLHLFVSRGIFSVFLVAQQEFSYVYPHICCIYKYVGSSVSIYGFRALFLQIYPWRLREKLGIRRTKDLLSLHPLQIVSISQLLTIFVHVMIYFRCTFGVVRSTTGL